MKIRKPAVAGSFYFDNKKEIERFVQSVHYKGKHEATAIISPHAGWIFSGQTAIKVIRELKPFKRIILLGVNHRGLGNRISLYENDYVWEFSNGRIKIDTEINNYIFINSQGNIPMDNRSHDFEHSIEVQLPLLIEEYGENFSIIPISIWDYSKSMLEFLSTILIKVMENFKDVVILASSDFTHYETAEYAKKMDSLAIEKILNNDAYGFYDVVSQYNLTICGFGPIFVLLKISKHFNLTPKMVEYTNSGAITNDYSQVVAYCGIEFI